MIRRLLIALVVAALTVVTTGVSYLLVSPASAAPVDATARGSFAKKLSGASLFDQTSTSVRVTGSYTGLGKNRAYTTGVYTTTKCTGTPVVSAGFTSTKTGTGTIDSTVTGVTAGIIASARSVAVSTTAGVLECDPNPVVTIKPTGPTGFPDATNTGVPAGTTLTRVPQTATSGPGWTWMAQYGTVWITDPGTTFAGYDVSGGIEVKADNVTVNNVQAQSAGYYTIQLRTARNVTITHSTLGGIASDSVNGWCDNAVRDIYGDSTNLTIAYDNLRHCSSGINNVWGGGSIHDNFIHDFGDLPGGANHFNGIQLPCGCLTGFPQLTIQHNTILNNADQSNAIALSTDAGEEHNRLVDNNLVGGGSYTIYGGGEAPESNVRITNNIFARAYPPAYGPFANPPRPGNGDVCTGNHYDDGTPITC